MNEVTPIPPAAAHPLPPLPFLLLLLVRTAVFHLDAASGYYQRSPCPRGASAIRRQFQLPDCRAPDLDGSLPIGEASFVMAHDAATGYLEAGAGVGRARGGRGGRLVDDDDDDDDDDDSALGEAFGGDYDGVDDANGGGGSGGNGGSGNGWSGAIASRLLSLYGKTQSGTAYDQLNDGARALDLRPKVYANGTVGFHHGSLIDVPLRSVTLGGLLDDARRWCRDNPTELVLLFHSELAHERGYAGLSTRVAAGEEEDGGYYYAGIARMRAVYGGRGVPYIPCEGLSGLTVDEVMGMADLSKTGRGGRGYLLAVDRHDMYGELLPRERARVRFFSVRPSRCSATPPRTKANGTVLHR
jgi:hypothetical protein